MTEYIHDRKIALKALVGSHNYGINDERSDRDYKYFVFPIWQDLYDGNRFTAVHNSDGEDYTVHDIRQLSKFLNKANINFLEVLFSKELTGDQDVLDLFVPLREMFVCMNFESFYHGCLGTFLKKMSLFHNSRIEESYNWKHAAAAYRTITTLRRYILRGESFENSISFGDSKWGDTFNNIRNADVGYNEFCGYSDELYARSKDWFTEENQAKVRARIDDDKILTTNMTDIYLSRIIQQYMIEK